MKKARSQSKILLDLARRAKQPLKHRSCSGVGVGWDPGLRASRQQHSTAHAVEILKQPGHRELNERQAALKLSSGSVLEEEHHPEVHPSARFGAPH